jgi:hypothetical protein
VTIINQQPETSEQVQELPTKEEATAETEVATAKVPKGWKMKKDRKKGKWK